MRDFLRIMVLTALALSACRQPTPPNAPHNWEKNPGLDPHPAGQNLRGAAPTALPRASFRLDPRRGLAADLRETQEPTEEERIYLKAAEEGQTWAQVKLGSLYVQQSGDTRRLGEGLRLLNAAAEKSDPEALRLLSAMALDGRGVQQSDKQAYALMRRAAETGSPEAQLELAELFASGRGVGRDTEMAIEWARKAAAQEFTPAQVALARQLITSAEEKRKSEALDLLQKAAEKDAQAALFFAAILATGRFEIEKDDWGAESLLRRWAEKGSADCQLALASLYQTSETFTDRRGESLEWLKRAADGGNKKAVELVNRIAQTASSGGSATAPPETQPVTASEMPLPESAPAMVDLSRVEPSTEPFELTEEEAQYFAAAREGKTWAQTRLGVAYARAKDDPQRLERAIRLLRTAAEADDPEAQYQLSVMYALGKGLEKSPVDALRYCRLAAEQGYLPAVYSLGSLMATGEAGFADENEAAKWFAKGAERGDPDSLFALANLKISGKGTPKDEAGAIKLLQKGSDVGDRRSTRLLAALTATGRGTQSDPTRAVSLLLPLANAGDAEAAYLLANLYAGNPELAAQRGDAMKYAQAAAASGKAEAMLTIANLYAQGIGVDADESKAQEWLRKAEETGKIRLEIQR